jgi:hypothetical protein
VTRIGYRGRWYDVPPAWDEFGWSIPYAFMRQLEVLRDPHPTPHPAVAQSLVSGFEIKTAVARRSLTKSSTERIPYAHLADLLHFLYLGLESTPALWAGLITIGVDDWRDGAWLVDNSPRSLRAVGADFDSAALQRLIQGQAWGQGVGMYVVLGIDFEFVSEDADMGYARALVDCGRLGQGVLLTMGRHGFRGRMTPALHESTGSEMFRLDPDRDVLYLLKLGLPS